MRIALVYDCLYPATVGGAERWLRALAEALAEEHDVTYVTRRQWRRGEDPLPGVRCVAVAPGGALHRDDGRRRLLPPVLFGFGVFVHFLGNRRRYDTVHCVSYPFAPLVAVRAALAGGDVRLRCEWLECLSDAYWRSYGPVLGRVGALLQRLCLRLTPKAVVFSRHTARRLRESGFQGPIELLGGLAFSVDGARSDGGEVPNEGSPLVLFAARHVPDKRAAVVPATIAAARVQRPDITAVVAGEGPERSRVLRRISELGLDGAVEAPGFVSPEKLEELYRQAACVLSPSLRDGYGMVVAEAGARGVPVVVCPGPDNAAAERVLNGVNGQVAASAEPDDIGAAIVDVIDRGQELRASVARWYGEHAEELSADATIRRACALYSSEPGRATTSGSDRPVSA
jgi:glycosyltransferase involved in cell wall biosynthesis